ncbi:TPA: hypothetical protein DDW35_02680 [Candidatus Sumerlaeota bacterium]|jgi:hypothetical protein|nr:hypothetical protein [Candidatus Sumerlaeota bacterium]
MKDHHLFILANVWFMVGLSVSDNRYIRILTIPYSHAEIANRIAFIFFLVWFARRPCVVALYELKRPQLIAWGKSVKAKLTGYSEE